MKGIISSKVLLRYIVSYLLLIGMLLLAVVFSMGILRGSSNAIIEEGNRLAIERYKAVMDAQFAALTKISNEFILDETIQEFLKKDEMGTADRYAALSICNTIRSTLQRYDDTLIQEVFLYFPQLGKVMTSSASVSDSLFFGGIYRLGTQAQESYEELFARQSGETFGALRDMTCTEIGTEAPMRVIYRTIMRAGSSVSGVIGFLLDQEALENLSRKDDDSETWEMFICTPDGRSMFSAQEDQRMANADSGMTAVSDTFGAQYRLVSDYTGLSAIMRSTEKTFFIILGVSVFGSLALACVLAFVNYRPIRRLWIQTEGKLSEKENQAPGNETFHNEIEDMDRHFSQMAHANAMQRNKLDLMRPVYSAKLLTDFVNGRTRELEVVLRKLEENGILLDKKCFLVMLLQIDVMNGEEIEEIWEDSISYEVSKSAVEAFSRIGTCCHVRTEEKAIQLLLNFDEDRTEEEIKGTAAALQRQMIEQAGLSVSFALGDSVTRERVWESAMQAQRTLETMYTGRMARVASYQDINGNAVCSVHFFQDYEIRMLNYIQSGSMESMENLLNEIFDADTQEITYLQTELLMLHVLEICLRAAQQLGMSFEKVYPYEETVLSHIRRFRHVSQFKGFILEMAGNMMREDLNRQKREESFKNKVIDFIRESYADINLNVSMIADRFGVSQSYLSTHFKRQTGINASDYIHLVRMNKAKELMRDMNLSLTQISKSIGYISDTTFIRSFKKYEGITPGTYRRNFVEPSAPGK